VQTIRKTEGTTVPHTSLSAAATFLSLDPRAFMWSLLRSPLQSLCGQPNLSRGPTICQQNRSQEEFLAANPMKTPAMSRALHICSSRKQSMFHTPPQVRQFKVLPRIHDIDIDPRLLLLGLHETLLSHLQRTSIKKGMVKKVAWIKEFGDSRVSCKNDRW
jgi:hypothetical protein